MGTFELNEDKQHVHLKDRINVMNHLHKHMQECYFGDSYPSSKLDRHRNRFDSLLIVREDSLQKVVPVIQHQINDI